MKLGHSVTKFIYLFSVKTSLEKILNESVEKKISFLTVKTECFKVLKIAFFQRG